MIRKLLARKQITFCLTYAIGSFLLFQCPSVATAQTAGETIDYFDVINITSFGRAEFSGIDHEHEIETNDDNLTVTLIEEVFPFSEKGGEEGGGGTIVTTELLELTPNGAKVPGKFTVDYTHNADNGYFVVSESSKEFSSIKSFFNVFADVNDFMTISINDQTPIFIHGTAPTSSLSILENGVRIGASESGAAAPLHIYSDGENGFQNAKVVVQNEHPDTGFREMFALINNGASRFTMENTNNNTKWGFASDALGRFTFSEEASDGPEFAITPTGRVTMGPGSAQTFDLRPNGNLFITGTLFQSSDRNLKSNFLRVDPDNVLQNLSKMPITTWQFNFDEPEVRHIGPTAQDFRKAFGLGENETTIAPVDGIGVSLVAIKALNNKIAAQAEVLDRQESKLRNQDILIDELTKRLERLESYSIPK